MMQCRLLFAIALFWCGEKRQSQDEMDAATRLTLDLGMYRRQFAEQNRNEVAKRCRGNFGRT
jgi:hypothetical protein